MEMAPETTLYGMFCGSNYTVTFDSNGGDGRVLKEMNIECNGTYGDLPNAERVGHAFLGWFAETEGGNSIKSGDRVTDFNNHTLYAHWTINNYTATFDFGNGTNIIVVLNHNNTIIYPEDINKLEGYTLGWTPNPARIPAENITVTAQWTPNNYTVTFDGNGGTPSKESMVVTYNSTYGDLPTASRTGYTFLGWFTEETGGEVTSEMTFLVADNQTLYAHWSINSYTVTFDFGNGTNTTSSFPFNDTITYPEDMTREGYIFNGWTPNPARMPAEDITVTAQWNETTEYVEIVFSTKDLSREQVEEIIEKYVPSGAEFIIEKFERDENTGETVVIIKFTDQREATNFIEEISTSSVIISVIKAVGFVEYNGSFSASLGLFSFIYFAL